MKLERQERKAYLMLTKGKVTAYLGGCGLCSGLGIEHSPYCHISVNTL